MRIFLIASEEPEGLKEAFVCITIEANGVIAMHAPQAAQFDKNFRRVVVTGTFFWELFFIIIKN